MRTLLKYIIIAALLHSSAIAQKVIPNTNLQPKATAPPVPQGYTNNTPVNYIRTWEPSMPVTDPAYVISANRTVGEVKQSTQYFDGLGRPLQMVIKGISPSGNDLVSPVVYDEFGRNRFNYLPYTADNISDGKFKLNPFADQKSFYEDNSLNPGTAGETIFFSETQFEASPLNRVEKTFAPGNSWASTGGNKPVEARYWINTDIDEVRIWDVTDISGNFGTYSSPGSYLAGQLYKNVTIDEEGNQVIEFKDKEGKVILKKVQLVEPDMGPGKNHDDWLCTYYIYDDLNNLRCVIQPEGVKKLPHNDWALSYSSKGSAAEQCFRYEYDGRNRMVLKKVPGAAAVEMVYDERDRLVFTRDGNLKEKGKWMVNFYDALNRPVMTALYSSAKTRAQLQSEMSAVTGTTGNINYTTAVANLTISTRESGLIFYEASNSIFFAPGFQSESNASFIAEIKPGLNPQTINLSVTNPLPNISGYEPLTFTFYDDYSYPGSHSALTTDFAKPQAGLNPYSEPNTSVSNQTRGMVTGSKVRIIGTNQWLTTTIFYNNKGRVIQSIVDNQFRGKDFVTSLYDFSGKLLSTYHCHSNPNSSGTSQTTVLTQMKYDATGRLLETRKKINDNSAMDRIIASNMYDELGNLKQKTLAPAYNNNKGLEKSNYEFNIRGWLKGINKNYVNNTDNSLKFGFELSYDYGFNKSQHNGNISGVKWRSKGDGEQRAYGFDYDAANRLLKGDFTQNNGGWKSDQGVDFSLKMGDGINPNSAYDANGNIKRMQQWGLKIGLSDQIDDMKYTYFDNSNKLQAVTEQGQGMMDHKLGDFTDKHVGEIDYGYDANGNLVTDLNKGMNGATGQSISSGGAIVYNFLNLPQSINVKKDDNSNKGTISYTYDATGNKLQKITLDNTVSPAKTIITDYIGGFIYENNELQFFSHEEGRIRPVKDGNNTITELVYDYFLKDHLGNIRMVLTDEKKIDRYPTATLEGTGEGSALSKKQDYFDINRNYVVNKPTNTDPPNLLNYTNDNGTNNPNTFGDKNAVSQKMYRLNGNTNRTGVSRILQVTSGDKIDILAKSYYKFNGTANNNYFNATDIINAFLAVSGGGKSAVHHGATLPILNGNNSGLIMPLNGFSDNNQLNSHNQVKAGINYIILDAQFNFVKGKFDPVSDGASGGLKDHMLESIEIIKNGYIYIYCSNESNIDAFFDNLEVAHTRGPILEETHYYPFGLTMAGISLKALNGIAENKFKYNGKEEQKHEFSDGSGLEWINYGARVYDPQIGRWHVQDNYSEVYYGLTPYNYAGNTPINAIDIDGNLFIFANGFMLSQWEAGQRPTEITSVRTGKSSPNAHYSPYIPDRGFYSDGPRNDGKKFQKDYWEGVDAIYKDAYKDENAYYTNGSFTPKATVHARFKEGLNAADALIAKLEAGEIALKDGEPIRIVGHSQGAAYAAGIATGLLGSKYGSLLEFVDYISGHQPGEIRHPALIKGRQFSTKSDQVSSVGPIARKFGNSKYEKIPGAEWGMERESHDGGRSGHSVGTWLNDLIDYFSRLGLKVTVRD